MNQSNLSKWLKGIVIGMAVFCAGIYGGILPVCGQSLVSYAPEFAHCFLPWMIFLLITAVPVFIALIFAWKVFTEIGRNNSFSFINARYLKNIAHLAIIDTVYFFLGNVVMLFANQSHPGILLASLLIDFLGIAVAVVCAALSHLVYKAAVINEENELTI